MEGEKKEMMKTDNLKKNLLKVVLTLAFVLVLGVVGGSKAEAASMPGFPTQSTSSYSASYTRGIQVMLMHYSNDVGSLIRQNGGADGVYGTNTKLAVMKFQKAVGFSSANQDGVCGKNTWTKLRNSISYDYASGSYSYYKGKYTYSSSSLYKNTMRLHKTNSNWYCWYGAWYFVG